MRSVARTLLKVLYWLVVVGISVALLVALVRFFEARDESDLEAQAHERAQPSDTRGALRRVNLAKTTMRCAAL